jgi:hypothetical protein
MVEQHNFESVLECGSNEAPHIVVAAKSVGEDHGAFTRTPHLDIVAFKNGQLRLL